MGLRQNSGMDRPAVIQTYGSVWITCVLVWIGGMDRPVGSGYGSGLYILTRSHIFVSISIAYCIQSLYSTVLRQGWFHAKAAVRPVRRKKRCQIAGTSGMLP